MSELSNADRRDTDQCSSLMGPSTDLGHGLREAHASPGGLQIAVNGSGIPIIAMKSHESLITSFSARRGHDHLSGVIATPREARFIQAQILAAEASMKHSSSSSPTYNRHHPVGVDRVHFCAANFD
jgi:hypothetical protein